MKKRLISSYDKTNDIFVGKVDGEKGYCADYGISDEIFIGVDNLHIPTSIFISNASEVFNIPKQNLESSNVKISINCDEFFLYFNLCIENLKIFSTKCPNNFNIPNMNFLIDSNY